MKGDWIVHSSYGIGQIIGKVKIKLSGERKTYFSIKIKDGRYWLSKDKTNEKYIRPLASLKQMIQALTLIQKLPAKLPKDYQENKTNILDIVGDGSLYSNARLIRDLHAKKLTSKLSKDERSWLKKLKNQLVYECSLVSGENKRTVERRLRKALKLSTTKRTN
jgi:RNA polymerase-interacting CarD/CdnL/TRCF family regulator